MWVLLYLDWVYLHLPIPSCFYQCYFYPFHFLPNNPSELPMVLCWSEFDLCFMAKAKLFHLSCCYWFDEGWYCCCSQAHSQATQRYYLCYFCEIFLSYYGCLKCGWCRSLIYLAQTSLPYCHYWWYLVCLSHYDYLRIGRCHFCFWRGLIHLTYWRCWFDCSICWHLNLIYWKHLNLVLRSYFIMIFCRYSYFFEKHSFIRCLIFPSRCLFCYWHGFN